ncbi:hypothetical protein [Methylocystis parvus]|uniref:hypothetical protein n=1 Tax=Methylocystis parvus TaxID=134 RepID=UPI003C718786
MVSKLAPLPVSALLPATPTNWPVYQNTFKNIDRLGRWTGGVTPIPNPRTFAGGPSPYFESVRPHSLGGGASPPTIYVVAHGWAPGYREAVLAQDGHMLWWGPKSSVAGVWASAWAWSGVDATEAPLEVNPTGMLQSIMAFDPNAIALAYSWIDDSATDSPSPDVLNLLEVYRSEAYTHINGLRLANALEDAIDPSFWRNGGTLRLIGHSHGSKVVSVAATTLQQRGRKVAHLTILDAPESETTLEVNAANLLGFYLNAMQIADPTGGAGAFVDNYASYFGVGYDGAPGVGNVVEVALDAGEVYSVVEIGEQHTYAAAWYGGAAAGGAGQGEGPLGFAWPPAPADLKPALNQYWADGPSEAAQWSLDPGVSLKSVFTYGTEPLTVTTIATEGNVQGAPSAVLQFGPGATPQEFAIFQGSYWSQLGDEAYGLAVDVDWSDPQPGDYLVFTVESPVSGEQKVVCVLDGQSQPAGATSIAIASAVWSEIFPLPIYVFFYSSGSVATVSNFRLVTVASDDGALLSRRLAEAQKRRKRMALELNRRETAS